MSDVNRKLTWDNLIVDFYYTHANNTHKITAQAAIKDLAQGNLSVREFFHLVKDKAHVAGVSDDVKAYFFSQGLNKDIIEHVDHVEWESVGVLNLNTCFKLAKNAEKHILNIDAHNNSKKGVKRVVEDAKLPAAKSMKVVGNNKGNSQTQNYSGPKRNPPPKKDNVWFYAGKPLTLPPGYNKY